MKSITFDKIMICLLFVMQLGFHTNASHDDLISLGVTSAIFLYFASRGNGIKVNLVPQAKKIIIWYTMIVLIAILSIVWAKYSNTNSVKSLVLEIYIPFILTVLCVSMYLYRQRDSIGLLNALTYAEVIVAIRAILYTPLPEMIIKMDSRLYGTGLGVNYNHFTTQLALVFCVALYLGFIYDRTNFKIKIAILFLAVNIIVSGSRKSLIVSAFALVSMYIIGGDRNRIGQKVKRILMIFIIIALIFYILISNKFLYILVGKKLLAALQVLGLNFQPFYSDNLVDSSAEVRNSLRQTALNIFMSNPIFGVGYYCFPKYNSWGIYAHNNYLELLADLGIVGFLAYYSFLFREFFKNINRYFFKKKSDVFHSVTIIAVFMISIFIIDYGHITFFRLYALVPLIVVLMAVKNMQITQNDLRR